MQLSALPWLQPLSPSTHMSNMQQLVFNAFTQLQQQQIRLLKSLQLQQQRQRLQRQYPTAPSQAAGSHAFLNQSSTLLSSTSQQHSMHQQALPYGRTLSPLCITESSVVLQLSGAHQGFKQPPGAPCSMPQSSRRKQFPATSLPDGSRPPCSLAAAASAAAAATANGGAAHPTVPANGPGSLQVTQQIIHNHQIAEQPPSDHHLDSDQQMENRAAIVSVPVTVPEHKQLASANSNSTSGKIQELSLVTRTKGSKECVETCKRLFNIMLHLTYLIHVCRASLLVYLSVSLHMCLCMSQYVLL